MEVWKLISWLYNKNFFKFELFNSSWIRFINETTYYIDNNQTQLLEAIVRIMWTIQFIDVNDIIDDAECLIKNKKA